MAAHDAVELMAVHDEVEGAHDAIETVGAAHEAVDAVIVPMTIFA